MLPSLSREEDKVWKAFFATGTLDFASAGNLKLELSPGHSHTVVRISWNLEVQSALEWNVK